MSDKWSIKIAGVPLAVYEAFEDVRQSGLVNMYDMRRVLNLMGDQLAVDYILANEGDYITIMRNYDKFKELSAD